MSSSLPLIKYEWQTSVDGNAFQCIDINERKYQENDGYLVIPNTTSDDILYYRLLVWNIIGGCVSNIVYLNVTGSMFSLVMQSFTFQLISLARGLVSSNYICNIVLL